MPTQQLRRRSSIRAPGIRLESSHGNSGTWPWGRPLGATSWPRDDAGGIIRCATQRPTHRSSLIRSETCAGGIHKQFPFLVPHFDNSTQFEHIHSRSVGTVLSGARNGEPHRLDHTSHLPHCTVWALPCCLGTHPVAGSLFLFPRASDSLRAVLHSNPGPQSGPSHPSRLGLPCLPHEPVILRFTSTV